MANESGFDNAAWMIDGARIPGDLSRVLAYAATSGAEGIVSPGDCRVHQLAVPGPQVEVDAGALIVLNRSAGVRNQSYVGNARTRSLLDVRATGSSGGRSDLVVVRMRDPQFKDWGTGTVPEEDLPLWQYVEPIIIENVPPNTISFAQLGLDYSGYALARIDIPAQTATITDAMVKNLREVAIPQRLRDVDRRDQTVVGEQSAPTPTNEWRKYPVNIPDRQIEVPAWATKAFLRGELTGVHVEFGAMAGGLALTLIGGTPSTTVRTKNTYFSESEAHVERESYPIGSTIDIPVAMRGQVVSLRCEMLMRSGTGKFVADLDTQLAHDIEFMGAAY